MKINIMNKYIKSLFNIKTEAIVGIDLIRLK